MAYAGRLAVIVGGLGGIGSVTGRLLLAKGARVALLHAPFESNQVPSLLESRFDMKHRKSITTHPCDITDHESVNRTFQDIADTADGIVPNMLINSAGYVSLSNMEETPAEEAKKTISVNLLGCMFTSQAFARMYLRLREQSENPNWPGGRIVSISSQAAHVALPLHGAYCASKAGVLGLTRSMACEWGPKGITANTVSPTVVWTALGQKAWADQAVREAFQAKIPTQRFAEPEEVASTIEYLCRDETAMINGNDVRIDGGFTIV